MSESAYDVAIIGGGPAGSTAAGLLAGRGLRVLLIERERFPRFHIGESLLPASQPILEHLGVARRVESEGFVVKRGASFIYEDGSTRTSIVFARGLDASAATTYQVARARFDQLLLETAAAQGALVREQVRATEVELGEHGVTLEIREMTDRTGGHEGNHASSHAGNGSERVEARFLIDASGRSGFLAKRLGLRQTDADLHNVAAYAHFEGVELPAEIPAGDIQVISRRDLSWLWLIPLSETLTSVGAVVPADVLRQHRGEKAAALDLFLHGTPVAAAQMARARRVTEVRYEADFSYGCSSYVGERWLLAGDAGSFIDPVFSTGVLLALEAGSEAADTVAAALERGGSDRASFARYDRRQRRRYRHFRRFVRSFYDPAFRDLLCQPSDSLGLVRATTSILAGVRSPGFSVRWRVSLFRLLVGWHRYRPLARRLHVRAAGERDLQSQPDASAAKPG